MRSGLNCGEMFGSPCSLRSAQCATLIALAAAAGISRFEPPVAETPAPVQSESAVPATPRQTGLRSYFVSVYAIAQHLGLIPVTTQPTVDHGSIAALAIAPITLTPPPLPLARVRFPRTDRVRLDPRAHAYPYAVGPPPREANSTDYATCTEVHGDSRVADPISNRPLFCLRTARPTGAPVDPESGGTRCSEISPVRPTGVLPLLVCSRSVVAPVGANPGPDAPRGIFPV